jgi:4-amino-4-deoxy-L-arabinose transferase-like glycosyltransferase
MTPPPPISTALRPEATPPPTALPAGAWASERLFLAILAGVVGFRMIALVVSPLSLHPDEAQYWAWSRSWEWGYFSKPPLIAWVIATTTALFGNAEWAVRLAAPLLNGLAAWLLYLLGRRLYSQEVGVFAGLAWLFIPAMWLSSVLASTDGVLLPLWALALLAFYSLMQRPNWPAAALLGFALGMGSLAKYAMLYFPLCAGLAAMWLPQARAAVLSRYGLGAGVIGLAILAPNLIWNALNDFATLNHTVANANIIGNEDLVNVEEAGSFFVDQLGMAGLLTVAFAVLLLGWGLRAWRLRPEDRLLLAFTVPPLAIILAQSFISRAHANWAAAAYPALVVLAVAFLCAPGRRSWLVGVMGAHLAGFALFAALILSPALADSLGAANAFKRLRGWDAAAQAAEARYREAAYGAILVDHRHLFFELRYQWRDQPALRDKLRMWVLRGSAGNHAELIAPMQVGIPGPALTVQMQPGYARFLAADFQSYAPLGTTNIPLGGGKSRPISFGAATGFAPKPRTPELLAEIGR